MSKWRMWVGVLAVFFCGLVFGWVGGGVYHKYKAIAHFERMKKSGGVFLADVTLERLTKEIDLTGRQRALIRPLLLHGFKRIDDIMREHGPKMDKIMREVADKLAEHLTPAQKEKLGKEGAWRFLRPPHPGDKDKPFQAPPPPPPPGR